MVFDKIYLMMPSRMVGSVQEPSAQANGTPLYVARPSAVTEKSALTCSKTFFRVEHGVGLAGETFAQKASAVGGPLGRLHGFRLAFGVGTAQDHRRGLDAAHLGWLHVGHAQDARARERLLGDVLHQTADDLTRRLAAEIDLLNVQRIGVRDA